MDTQSKAGRYELSEELGRGAMGVVYKAFDPVIGRNVAVKTMRLTEEGTGLKRAELSARFKTEARAAGLLTHPNIVVVYDAGEEDGLYYITMEYVEGKSLQAMFDAKQSFPLPRTLRLVEQVCSALDYAHRSNVVHRDIKPANLMLAPDDTVKITDFGTAKIMRFGSAQTTHIIGTPSYMSPEQIKGKAVDGRSDIFALGVILYELVTGEKPFPGQNVTTVIYKIVNEEPIPPRELDASIHPSLSAVITRALAKEPAARFQSCREMLEALRNYRNVSASPEATMVSPTAAPVAGASSPARATVRTAPPFGAGVSSAIVEEPRKRNLSWLVVLLLAIIAGASYRVSPYMLDIWHRNQAARASAAPSAAQTPPAPAPVEAAGKPSAPAPAPVRADGKPSAPAPAPAPNIRPAEPPKSVKNEKPTEKPAPEPKAPPESAAVNPAPRAPENPAPPNAAAVAPRLNASEIKARMEERLALTGLGKKVHIQAAGNTFTLTGQLTTREYRQLLRQLHNAPAWIHLVDHIEFADPGANQPSSADPAEDERPKATPGRGEIEVLTDVIGATAVLRGALGGVAGECRTPCRFEDLRPGRYSIEVIQPGYLTALRIVQLRAGSIVPQRIELTPSPKQP
jgi:serine/threonine protein kinase